MCIERAIGGVINDDGDVHDLDDVEFSAVFTHSLNHGTVALR